MQTPKLLVVIMLFIGSSLIGAGITSDDHNTNHIDYAIDLAAFYNLQADYNSRPWYRYWPAFNVYKIRRELTDEQQYAVIFSFLEDTASLVRPHFTGQCDEFFALDDREVSRTQRYSRNLAMYAGVFSLDPEVGHAWMMYLLERSWWARIWGGYRLRTAFMKSCTNPGVTVEQAMVSIVAGYRHAYEAE
jgi:hypothetical protein